MRITHIRRAVIQAVVAVLVVGGTLVVTSEPALAVNTWGMLVNVPRPDMAISIQGEDTNYGRAHEYGIASGYNFWDVVDRGDGHTMQERDAWEHRCLDSNFAGEVYGIPCNGGGYQRWWWNYKGTWYISWYGKSYDVYEIVNKATGRCLDANGADVYTLACNGGNYQRWYVPW